MSSPFAVLRRNQKTLLAVFGVIIMVVFVVGSSFDNLFTSNRRDREISDVVRWKHGTLTEMDLAALHHRNQVTAAFLEEIGKRARERKGTPKVAAMQPARSDRELVRRMVLARKATDSGIVVSDEAVKHYLTQVGDGKLSDRDYAEILRSIPNRRVGDQQIFEELRTQLAADNQLRMMAVWGWSTITPGVAWDYYNRVHHRVQAEVLPLKVEDYLSDVADPSDSELRKFYEEHKNNFSHPDLPKPGFRQRPQASFAYVKFEFDKYVEQEKAKLTEEELKAEYDARIKRGEFKVPELPSAPNKPGDAAEKPDGEKPDAEKPGDEKPSDEKPGDKPADEKPADKPEAKKPEEKPADKPEEKPADKPAEDKKPADEKKPEDKPAEEKKPAEPKPECQDQATEKPDAAEKPAEKADAKPADAKPEEKPAEKPAEKTAKPAEKAKEETAEKPEEKPAETPEEKPAEEAKPKFRTFEEVREEIALSLARPRAQQVFKKAKTAVRKELDAAARELRVAIALRERTNEKSELPPPPDGKAIADKHGLAFGEVPLVDPLTVTEHELGQASLMSFMGGFRQITFAEVAFRDALPQYTIEEIPGGDPNVTFLFWKTDKKGDRVPKLEEIREQVVRSWKMRKAVDKAKADAEKKAQEARDKENLAEAFGDKVENTNLFSWVTSGAAGFGMGAPALSRVENVVSPGDEFMEAVFSLKVGEVGVAVNHPESVVYVVRIVREGLNEEIRRTQFIQSGLTRDVSFLAFDDGDQGRETWMSDLEKELNVQWLAAPQEESDGG